MRSYRVALLIIRHAEAVKLRRAVVMNNRHHHAADLLLAHVLADESIDGKPPPVMPHRLVSLLGGLICDSVPAQPETNSNANSTRPNRLFKLHLPAARFGMR